MSLLQEALKRKEQDQEPSPPEPGAAPVAPAQAPDASKSLLSVLPAAPASVPPDAPPQAMPVLSQLRSEGAEGLRRKSSMLWVIVAVMAIFISVTITAGMVYFFYRLIPASKVKVVPAVPASLPPAAGAPANMNQVAGQAAVPDVKKEPAGGEAPQPAVASPAPTAVQRQATGGAERKPAARKPAFSKAREPAGAPAAKWPLLKLSGILRGSGNKEHAALINGKMVNAGQVVENVTLLEVQTDGVILQYGGETRFLRVGAVSY